MMMMTSAEFWRGGDRVEVERVLDGATVYFPATVANTPSVRKNLVLVEHESLMFGGRKEYVVPTRLRPSRPREIDRRFKVGDEVDVFRSNEGFWVRGKVKNFLEKNLSYMVEFKGENRPEAEVDNSDMRLHREWKDGVWVTSVSMSKRVKLKIKFRRRYEYGKGDTVEVRSEEEEAYKGSWYCARILSVVGDDTYVVEHLRFKRKGDESMIPLRVLVESKNMRPVPSTPTKHEEYKGYEAGDEVDAWFNKRWWIGRVSKVLEGGSKYLVYFISTGEEPIVLDFNLRPHKDWNWIIGQWTNLSKEESVKPCDRAENVEVRSCKRGYQEGEECCKPPLKKLKPCDDIRAEKNVLFNNGMMVEVRSDEQGYEGAWYSARIVRYLGRNRYTVEYQTLKTDDQSELLKEEASGSDIRPIPPPVIQKACGGYELNEDVDAWYNPMDGGLDKSIRETTTTRVILSTLRQLMRDCCFPTMI